MNSYLFCREIYRVAMNCIILLFTGLDMNPCQQLASPDTVIIHLEFSNQLKPKVIFYYESV